MNNKQRFQLIKLAAGRQINPMDPALQKGFNVGGANYQLDQGPSPELGPIEAFNPANMTALGSHGAPIGDAKQKFDFSSRPGVAPLPGRALGSAPTPTPLNMEQMGVPQQAAGGGTYALHDPFQPGGARQQTFAEPPQQSPGPANVAGTPLPAKNIAPSIGAGAGKGLMNLGGSIGSGVRGMFGKAPAHMFGDLNATK